MTSRREEILAAAERAEMPHPVGPHFAAWEAKRQNGNGAAPETPLVWETPVAFTALPRPPFPLDALPPFLARYVAAVAEATQTAPDLAAAFVLSSFAGAVARKVEVVVRRGFREPVNLYTMAVALPAERKSAINAEIVRPWDAAERQAVEVAAIAIARQDAQREVVKKERDNAITEAAKSANMGDQEKAKDRACRLSEQLATTDDLFTPILRTEDTTPERLKTLLAEQRGRIAVFASEGEVFKIAEGRYSGNGGASFDGLLKGHAGDTLRVDRQSRPSLIVSRPALTIACAVQPDVVEALFHNAEFRGRGLTARFLYCWPTSRLGQRAIGEPVPDDVRAAYDETVTALLGWPMPDEAAPLTLDAAATQVGLDFERWIEPRLHPDSGDLSRLSDWAGKLAGATYRLMGVLHLAEHGPGASLAHLPPIGKETADRAVRLAHYFIGHAQVVYNYGGADPVASGAKKVLDWLRLRGLPTFVERECFNAHRAQFVEMADLRRSLDLLEDYHYIRQQAEAPRLGAGRKPSPTYAVNPATFTKTLNAELTPNYAELPHSADSADSAVGSGIYKKDSLLSIGSVNTPICNTETTQEAPKETPRATPPAEYAQYAESASGYARQRKAALELDPDEVARQAMREGA